MAGANGTSVTGFRVNDDKSKVFVLLSDSNEVELPLPRGADGAAGKDGADGKDGALFGIAQWQGGCLPAACLCARCARRRRR